MNEVSHTEFNSMSILNVLSIQIVKALFYEIMKAKLEITTPIH